MSQFHELSLAELDQTAPKWRAGVARVKASGADTVVTNVRAFYHEPELLYAALRYASEEGVTVTMYPMGTDTDDSTNQAAA